MFGLDKKLKFYEDQDLLAIEFKWISPMAFFFLFFTIIWNVFLVFWYSMALMGSAPLVFILFPLLHVAVGLGLIYFTTCQFLNKTNIEIDDNYLSIRHSPIPWWRGNVEIPTGSIDQLYVKETISQGKNGTSRSYALRAKLKDGADKEVLSVTGVESPQMLEIETQLERFIGIIDRPVKGEYRENQAELNFSAPRRQGRDFTDSPFGVFYFLEKGEVFNLREEAVKLLSISQFDWNDGNTDKFFQLSNEKHEERLLYFEQNRALLEAFMEKPLNLAEIGHVDYKTPNVPESIVIKGTVFKLGAYKKGKKFIIGVAEAIEVEQWVYLSDDKLQNIRVIDNNGVIHYYQGEALHSTDFEDRLELKDPAAPDLEYGEPDWEEDELV